MSFVAGVGAAPCRVQCYNDINDNKEGHQHPYNRPVHLLCVSFCSGREEDRDRKKKRLEGRGGRQKLMKDSSCLRACLPAEQIGLLSVNSSTHTHTHTDWICRSVGVGSHFTQRKILCSQARVICTKSSLKQHTRCEKVISTVQGFILPLYHTHTDCSLLSIWNDHFQYNIFFK